MWLVDLGINFVSDFQPGYVLYIWHFRAHMYLSPISNLNFPEPFSYHLTSAFNMSRFFDKWKIPYYIWHQRFFGHLIFSSYTINCQLRQKLMEWDKEKYHQRALEFFAFCLLRPMGGAYEGKTCHTFWFYNVVFNSGAKVHRVPCHWI